MALVNRIAQGYLALIGNTTGGRLPPESANVVTPTVDIGKLLEGNFLAKEFVGQLPAAFPADVSLKVPLDETWVLVNIGFSQTVVLATDTVEAIVSLRSITAGGPSQAFGTLWETGRLIATGLAAPSRMTKSLMVPTPLVLQSGSELITTVNFQNIARQVFFSFLFLRLTG